MLLDAAGFRLDVDVCRRPHIGAAATATACRSSSQCMVSWIKLVWHERIAMTLPIGSMYGIYANIYHQYTPNVSIYTIHGSYGLWFVWQYWQSQFYELGRYLRIGKHEYTWRPDFERMIWSCKKESSPPHVMLGQFWTCGTCSTAERGP